MSDHAVDDGSNDGDNIFDRRTPIHFPLTEQGSNVVRVNSTLRLAHVTSFLPLSSRTKSGNAVPTPFYIDMSAAAFLAFKHFNERNPRIIWDLEERTRGCDVQLTLDARDTQYSQLVASKHLSNAVFLKRSSFPLPTAILGAVRSAVSQPLSILAGTFQIPQVSPLSTSSILDQRDIYPYFGRVIPTNNGDADALLTYFESLGVRHFGVIYISDSYGTLYATALSKGAKQRGMNAYMTPYDTGHKSIEHAVEKTKNANVKYVFAVPSGRDLNLLLRTALRFGIIGKPEYSWTFADGAAEYTQKGFAIEGENADLASAINGIGVLMVDSPANLDLMSSMEEYGTSKKLQNEFIRAHYNQGIFDSIDYRARGPAVTQVSQLYYDAMMSIGLAACASETDLFTGPEFYKAFKNLNFTGSSGPIFFDQETGTRAAASVRFAIKNVIMDNDIRSSNDDKIYFSSQISSLIWNQAIEPVFPFVYADGRTEPPDPYPPLEVNFNFISSGTIIFGAFCVVVIVVICILCAIFLYLYRKRPTVRASQPAFLSMSIVGPFLMATAIIPMTFQEPVPIKGLDIACMSRLWLFSIGFVTSFSALYCKMHRLNKLRKAARKFRRIVVKTEDVLYPFVILMALNLTLLIVWTVVDPLRWRRIDVKGAVDSFGRATSTFATCSCEYRTNETVFFSLYAAINLLALIFAQYEGFTTRNHPKEFQEIFYITLSFGCLLEGAILGLPVLFFVKGNPTASFVVQTTLIFIVCLAILLPLFVPKYLNRNGTVKKKKRKISVDMSPISDDDIKFGLNGNMSMISDFSNSEGEDFWMEASLLQQASLSTGQNHQSFKRSSIHSIFSKRHSFLGSFMSSGRSSLSVDITADNDVLSIDTFDAVPQFSDLNT